MDVSIIAIDHFLKNNWIEIKARKIHPADCNLSTPRVISITRRTNGGWLLCRGVLPTRLNVLWIFYYLCAFPPGAGYIMQDARVLEGVHACVSSTTILARMPWMNLWEKGDIHIYIYILFSIYRLHFTQLLFIDSNWSSRVSRSRLDLNAMNGGERREILSLGRQLNNPI